MIKYLLVIILCLAGLAYADAPLPVTVAVDGIIMECEAIVGGKCTPSGQDTKRPDYYCDTWNVQIGKHCYLESANEWGHYARASQHCNDAGNGMVQCCAVLHYEWIPDPK